MSLYNTYYLNNFKDRAFLPTTDGKFTIPRKKQVVEGLCVVGCAGPDYSREVAATKAATDIKLAQIKAETDQLEIAASSKKADLEYKAQMAKQETADFIARTTDGNEKTKLRALQEASDRSYKKDMEKLGLETEAQRQGLIMQEKTLDSQLATDAVKRNNLLNADERATALAKIQNKIMADKSDADIASKRIQDQLSIVKAEANARSQEKADAIAQMQAVTAQKKAESNIKNQQAFLASMLAPDPVAQPTAAPQPEEESSIPLIPIIIGVIALIIVIIIVIIKFGKSPPPLNMMPPGMMPPGMMPPGMMPPGMMPPGRMPPGRMPPRPPGVMQPGVMQPVAMIKPGVMQPVQPSVK
jgi:hypothetical protein